MCEGINTASHLLSEFPSDVALSLDTVKTVGLQATVAQHLDHLGVLLTGLFEDQFSFVALVLVFTSPAVLSSLSYTTTAENRVSS